MSRYEMQSMRLHVAISRYLSPLYDYDCYYLWLKINEHMTSVGDEILCVLDKQQRCVKLVRVFVLKRLGAAASLWKRLVR